jgi:hypothetical protein
MSKHTLLLAAFALAACSGDSTESTKGKVDVDDPATVLDPDGDGEAEAVVEMDVASVAFELAEPLPEIDFRVDGTEDAAVMDVMGALSLVVSSPRSGVSVSLADDGEMVSGMPEAPGEWSVELSDDRKTLTFSWFNATASGLTMKSGEPYDVLWSLGDNCCISEIDETAIKMVVD